MVVFEFSDLLTMFEGELTVFLLEFLLTRFPEVLVLLVSLKDRFVELVKFGLFLFVFVKLFFEKVDFFLKERTLTS